MKNKHKCDTIYKTLNVKQTMKTKILQHRSRFVALIAIAVFGFGGVVVPMVRADQFDEQIKQIQADSSNKQAAVNQLQAQADSYQDAINKLQQQISAIQAQIRENEAKRDDLQKQIDAAEVELAKQKKLLGENIKTMYVEGEISTLEMLASSKDLSEFLDKQQYRSAVQDKIKATLDKINALKQQLKDQKTQIEQLLANQQDMNNQLNSNQAEQNRLLSLTVDQQNAYTAQIKANSSQISALRAQQAAANRKLGGSAEAGDPGRGGYPNYLYSAAQDSLVDPWGMYNRECVSYTAWKVYQAYGHMPYWGGHGNANQWPASAQADGIPTSSTPKAGAVAISMAGYYGHAMWVEAVYSNGYIRVSQMNYDLAGHYSEMTINGAGLTYIYFN